MSATGYDFASVYSNWVAQNQYKVAQMRLGDSLSGLCQRKFQIPISAATLEKWSTLSVPILCDLLATEEESEDLFDAALPMRKKDVLVKYLGASVADEYEDYFSLHHDAYQIMERLKMMAWKKHMVHIM